MSKAIKSQAVEGLLYEHGKCSLSYTSQSL